MGHNQRKLLKTAVKLPRMQLENQSNLGNSSGVLIPSGVIAGDLLIISALNTSSSTPPSAPAGWAVYNVTPTGGFGSFAWKVADGSESGSYIHINGGYNKWYTLVLRSSSAPLISAVALDVEDNLTGANPSAQTINAATIGTEPKLPVALYGSAGAVTSPSWTGSSYDVENSYTTYEARWTQFDATDTPSDITVNLGDGGSINLLASMILELTF